MFNVINFLNCEAFYSILKLFDEEHSKQPPNLNKYKKINIIYFIKFKNPLDNI